MIAEKTKVIATLLLLPTEKRFDLDVRENVSAEAMAKAKKGTVNEDSELVCPNPACKAKTPIKAIRGDGRHINHTCDF